MRRKKPQLEMAVKCDYCGSSTDTFVVNAEHLIFCRNQMPGYPAIKDCMENYLKDKKNKKEEILIKKNSAIKKLAELKQLLNNKKHSNLNLK